MTFDIRRYMLMLGDFNSAHRKTYQAISPRIVAEKLWKNWTKDQTEVFGKVL